MTQATKCGILCYDEQADRFRFQSGEQSYALHCGESLGLRMGGHFEWGRLEMDRAANWYIIFSAPDSGRDTALTLRNTNYDAQIHW